MWSRNGRRSGDGRGGIGSQGHAPQVSRLDRRKARTRQALIDAAVRLIAEGRGDRASIQEITEAADIGFGSFYNHFDSKEQLFQTASEEVLERWGQMIDRASAGISDPAELFAVGMRISGRLGWTHPDIAGFLTGAGLDALDIPVGLAPRALRDIQAGQAAGRFTVPDAEIALSAVAGGLLGLLRTAPAAPRARQRGLRRPARRGRAAPARRPRPRSRPPRRPAAPGHWRLVTAAGCRGRPPPAATGGAGSPRARGQAQSVPRPAPCLGTVIRRCPGTRDESSWRHVWLAAADPPRRPVLFVNPRSGGGKAARARGCRAGARKRESRRSSSPPARTWRRWPMRPWRAGADALGMAGGDGSLAVVAAAAAAHGIPFVCVPAGTRNHFALDVGVDRHDVTGALDAFTDGVERQIDMAEVNGRTFLNNVSLGIYGEAVRSPSYRNAKMRTLLQTAAEVRGPSAEAPGLRLVDDLGREHRDLAVVLVSNNPYALDRPLVRGTRPALDTGQLGILALDAPGAARTLQVEPGAPRAWR